MKRILLTSLFLLVASALIHAGEPTRLWNNLKAGKSQTIVMYGTSLTAGGPWVGQLEASLQRQFPNLVTIINSGKSAMFSEWGRTNIEELVVSKKPDAVFIEFAINDAFLEYECTVEQARKNLEEMLDKILEKNPQCEIYLQLMNPPVNNSTGSEPKGPHLDRRPNYLAYYDMYRGVANARGARLVDHHTEWKAVLDRDRKTFDKWVPDGIHPNVQGSEHVITPNILAVLQGKK